MLDGINVMHGIYYMTLIHVPCMIKLALKETVILYGCVDNCYWYMIIPPIIFHLCSAVSDMG